FVYAVGILSVFAVLTALAVVLSFNWGQQFTYFPVRLGLTLLMFAMALSYLGVWEIPVPGMAAGKTSQALQQREGYTGAFFKGVFATVLATPCSGPLLGGILGLTFALTSLQTTAVIMTVGVGMALPYLMIGIWPSLVAWLPKPGTWMETLKEFLAFLFLGTVAFFFNQFSDGDKLPVFVALIGVWFGCWIIGKVPSWSSLQSRLYAWSGGVASAMIIGFAAFQWLGPAPEPAEGVKTIAWQPYDEAKLNQYQAEGRTVMIDFTAKWCVNCIVNYNVALNTEPTRQLIEELDAVPMLADWTDQDAEIEAKLKELESRSIPVLAIYPGKSPAEPIVLRDLVSQQMVLDALEDAGPSVSGSAANVAIRDRSNANADDLSMAPAVAGMATR
ncbi:protein-disulfide reductase DsbD family protein, partial [Rhodopirellula bahusiensis]